MAENNLGRLLLLWAFVFLVLGIIAAIYGMAGGAIGATRISLILFVLFLALMAGFFLTGRRPTAKPASGQPAEAFASRVETIMTIYTSCSSPGRSFFW